MNARYRVTFRSPDDGETRTLRCNEVGDSPLGLGFVTVSGLDFETSSRIVDPKAQQLQQRFSDVRRLHLHLHAVLCVEELSDDVLELEADRSKLIVLERPDDS
ncbi:MAG TPA: DUF1820 family protein [Deltaproteobacteria bacterium]|nr:DUF1820 family protein [Deltaproteobacteria bacterium]